MLEVEIRLIDRSELNFDKSFLHFNVKKQIYAKSHFKITISNRL